MLGKVFPKLSGYRLKTLPNRHFTVVCLVALSLNESEAGDEFVLKETSLQNSIINKRKAERFFSKQIHLQPHFHSKARQLITQL